MKETKEKPMAMEFSMTFDTKEDLRKFIRNRPRKPLSLQLRG